MKVLSIFTLVIMMISCSPSPEQVIEKTSTKLEIESQTLISKLKVKDLRGEYYLSEPIDSVEYKWAQIFQDSAQLGYQFIYEFDSLFEQRNEAARVEQLATIEKEIKKIASNFTYKKDDFQDLGFYSHKRWGRYWPNRKTLTSGVNSSGYAWIKSNYSADDWIFHTSITVLVGDLKYQSEEVATFSDKNVRDNDAGRVWEIVTYDNPEILKAIAENSTSTIKVRFNGSEFYSDQTLSSGDKKALKDCYDLAQVIKEKKKLSK
jgi:hypothetical protein